MKKQLWSALDNQFINVTRDSYRLTVHLSGYHDAQLNAEKAANPLLAPLYTRYHPLHLALLAEYSAFHTKEGIKEGQSTSLKNVLTTVYNMMYNWDLTIQGLYKKKSPEYKSIFPNGRKPFTTGSIDDKIEAYNTLAGNLSAYDSLETTMNEIAAQYVILSSYRTSQEGAKGSVKSGSAQVETARINAMTMQWRNLGFVMDAFATNLPLIESLYDREAMNKAPQRKFTGTLDMGQTKAIVTRTFIAIDEIRLKNTGLGNVKFYLADVSGGINSTAITVAANLTRVIDVSEFGVTDYATHRFLTVVNESLTDTTSFVVELL